MGRQRLPAVPSAFTGPLRWYLQEIKRALDDTPVVSYFSGTNPNTSGITGFPGDQVVNVGSASTSTRVWLMSGSSQAPATTGWVMIRIAT